MMLKIHLHGAEPYEIGPEIWQQPLADAIRAEAETIAADGGSDLLGSPDQKHRDRLRDLLIAEMLRPSGRPKTPTQRPTAFAIR